MNAGAMGAQTFENVVRVRYLDGEGNAHEKTPAELEVHYRHVPSLDENYAVSAVFKGTPAAAEEIDAAAGRIAGETPDHPAEREERRLHFQESGEHVRPGNWWTSWG